MIALAAPVATQVGPTLTLTLILTLTLTLILTLVGGRNEVSECERVISTYST